MKWEIAENCRVDVVGYSGINYSGDKFEARVFPSGRQGDELDGSRIQSMAILGPLGARVTLVSSLQDDWEAAHTWRVVTLVKGFTWQAKDGRHAVRIPDLDALNKPDAFRVNPDFQESYPLVKKVADGKGWTFGHQAREQLKNGVVLIKVSMIRP
jgi:hypothetical protein